MIRTLGVVGLLAIFMMGCSPATTPSAAEPSTPADPTAATPASAASPSEVPPTASLSAEEAPTTAASAPADRPQAACSPATAAEAALVLDLRALELPANAEQPSRRTLAGLSYAVPGNAKEAYEFWRKTLQAQRWREGAQSFVSDETCSGNFERDGYKLSVMAYVSMPGKAAVSITNHGNIDLTKLPLPADCTLLYAGPIGIAHVTAAPVEATAAEVKKLLTEQKWVPYGSAGDVAYYRQNAIRLSARVMAAPAQQGKTVIDYSSELLSVELPAPDDAIDLRYTDGPIQVFFDSPSALQEVHDFYKQALAPTGWKATTETPVKVDFHHFFIFRNEAMDMWEAKLTEVDGKTRVLMTYSTAAEVAEQERRAKEAIEKKKATQDADKSKPAAKLPLTLPAAAKDVVAEPQEIKFSVPTGQAKAVVEALRKQLLGAGYKEVLASLEPVGGSVVLKQGEQMLTVFYVDSGVLPAEVTITAQGIDLAPTSKE